MDLTFPGFAPRRDVLSGSSTRPAPCKLTVPGPAGREKCVLPSAWCAGHAYTSEQPDRLGIFASLILWLRNLELREVR